jgi:hypothetical protein
LSILKEYIEWLEDRILENELLEDEGISRKNQLKTAFRAGRGKADSALGNRDGWDDDTPEYRNRKMKDSANTDWLNDPEARRAYQSGQKSATNNPSGMSSGKYGAKNRYDSLNRKPGRYKKGQKF